MARKLRISQVDTVLALLQARYRRCYLLSDVGSGKTAVCLHAIYHIRPHHTDPWLIVAPKLVAHTVWLQEQQYWPHLKTLRIEVVRGTQAERRRILRRTSHVFVINYELLPWLAGELDIAARFKHLVFDEITRLKRPNKIRFRVACKAADQAEHVWGLTGTPLATSYLDLFGQFRIVDAGQSLGKYITHFRNEHFVQLDPEGYRYGIKPRHDAQIIRSIRSRVFHVKQPVTSVKPLVDVIKVSFNADLSQRYWYLYNEFLLEVRGEIITADNAGVRSGKLCQFTGGGMYLEDGAYEAIHDAKLQRLDELLESLHGQPTLIVYAFKGEAHRIMDRYPETRWLGLQSSANEGLIKCWNERKLFNMRLLIHPQSAGHGLNLQSGGHHIIFYGGVWSQEMYRQVVGRLARSGQPERVIVHHLLCENSIDQLQYDVMCGRIKQQDDLIKQLKAYNEKDRETD